MWLEAAMLTCDVSSVTILCLGAARNSTKPVSKACLVENFNTWSDVQLEALSRMYVSDWLCEHAVDCVWIVMANQTSSSGRNGRVHLNRLGCQFSRLLAAEVRASAVVMLVTPCSEVVWRVLSTHSIHQFPFPSVTVCHHISDWTLQSSEHAVTGLLVPAPAAESWILFVPLHVVYWPRDTRHFIYVLGCQFWSSDHHQAIITQNIK
jgi:hypothetical protein